MPALETVVIRNSCYSSLTRNNANDMASARTLSFGRLTLSNLVRPPSPTLVLLLPQLALPLLMLPLELSVSELSAGNDEHAVELRFEPESELYTEPAGSTEAAGPDVCSQFASRSSPLLLIQSSASGLPGTGHGRYGYWY